MFSKVIESLEQNIRKQVDCNEPSSIKEINKTSTIPIELCKQKHNQIRLVLEVFAFTQLASNHIKQIRCI